MSIQERYLQYVEAFEETYIDDDWSRLEEYFTADSMYDNGDGSVGMGREAVLEKLKNAVDGLDRKMTQRIVSFAPPTSEGNTVTSHWTAEYTMDGAPNLKFTGVEFAVYEGDRIAHLRDEMDDAAVAAITNWLAQHGALLQDG
ncbi:nuclear transport factor 2 family protein [Marinobacter alexandrii]|uniref:nuclear transport factor 2 family protein n=1 Tax=Marinobacter alexandrii TaxID=2570351 RepID=UPI00329A1668